ncbi:DUF3604 domain-containing protein [Seongchinamella sediminis]|uniref:DUF3604 domain-containing protein n=1 Tax=Seongchinamella sediminis TaxID=2283635 RepID=UPI0013C2D7F8|nr:DUF3604 domain-containing protein [Seongchinamella sediminis]
MSDDGGAGEAVAPAALHASPAPQIDVKPLREVYFGNLHVHTSWSFDAFANGAATGPDEAYRWARGEQIAGGGDGTPLKIKAPLDWYAVSDHAEYLGALPLMADSDSPLSKHPLAAAITGDDAEASFNAYTEVQNGIYYDDPDPVLGDPAIARSVWRDMVDIADAHNSPGEFTTFAAFEWTSAPDYRNLHRVVLFADTDRVPDKPLSAIDTDKPEELWQWMDAQRAAGSRLLAVPHNGNASNGVMFPVEESFGGSELNRSYAQARMRNEPLYELTQIKGTSETHPMLTPNDEFAAFELWDYTLASTATPPEKKLGGYMREALIRGLKLDAAGKGNPFKYGFIGDSDTHNSASAVEEDNYTGKFGFENNPEHRLQGPPGVSEAGARQVRQFSSGGLAGVWAEANTRDALFAALQRKETFATSGPRLKVRFFGGFGLSAIDLAAPDGVNRAYAAGVPMGGDLKGAPENAAPTFLVQAIRETEGANLDRIQVIKGWIDDAGEQQHAIYDIALSDDREPGPDGRVPPVGNTVNPEDASYSNSIGEVQLQAKWTDPDFDPSASAVYYARVLQIPTPRWSTYDAVRTGMKLPDGLPVSIQERAWTSPIWYTP